MKFSFFMAILVICMTGAGCQSEETNDVSVEENTNAVSRITTEAVEGDSISDAAVVALQRAIDDEYKALTTYDAVIDQFGAVRPFSNIRKAEEKHIQSLEDIFMAYGLSIPENGYTAADVPVFSELSSACAYGVQAEVDNVALYRDELLPVVAEYQNIQTVFTNLQAASKNNHLPAFERCAL
jgi:hypothetical protein